MKILPSLFSVLVLTFCAFSAQANVNSKIVSTNPENLDVDPDLPQEPELKIGKKTLGEIAQNNQYLIYSEVPTAVFGVYNDLNKMALCSYRFN